MVAARPWSAVPLFLMTSGFRAAASEWPIRGRRNRSGSGAAGSSLLTSRSISCRVCGRIPPFLCPQKPFLLSSVVCESRPPVSACSLTCRACASPLAACAQPSHTVLIAPVAPSLPSQLPVVPPPPPPRPPFLLSQNFGFAFLTRRLPEKH